MTIHLSSEQENIVGQAIAAGVIHQAEDVVEVGLETIRRRLEVLSKKSIDVEQWVRDFEAWVNSHSRSTPPLSDEAISRESIYGSRGF